MPDLNPAHHKTAKLSVYLIKSMTPNFTKKLPTLGIRYKAIPDPEPTLPEGLLPNLPDPTRGIDTSLLLNNHGLGAESNRF